MGKIRPCAAAFPLLFVGIWGDSKDVGVGFAPLAGGFRVGLGVLPPPDPLGDVPHCPAPLKGAAASLGSTCGAGGGLLRPDSVLFNWDEVIG